MAPHALLNEIGKPADFIKIDDDKNEQKGAKYLRVNPHGRVPTLIYDGDKVMYESAAICLFLTERHPEAVLAPKPGDPDRGLLPGRAMTGKYFSLGRRLCGFACRVARRWR